MIADATTLLVSRCLHCHSRFLPRPGRCRRCGSVEIAPHRIPSAGVVLAATELLAPSSGWTAPHRIALVELPESVRVLALVMGELPAMGAPVRVRRDVEVYLVEARASGSERGAEERGEGDSPGAGLPRPPFEPPR